MAVIEREGNRIILSGVYIKGLGNRVPGAYFSGYRRIWTMPLTLETCIQLREVFGQQLQIGPALWAWAKSERESRARLGDMSAAFDAEVNVLPRVAPFLAKAMEVRKYQRAGVRFIVEGRNVLIADDPGLGKTLEAIGGIVESGLPGPYLVVTPKTAVESVWARELPRWVPGVDVLTVPDGRAYRDAALDKFVGLYETDAIDQEQAREVSESLNRTWVVVHPEMARTKSWWTCRRCGKRTPWTTKPTPTLDCGHTKDAVGVDLEHEHVFPQLFSVRWGAMIVDESHDSLVRKSGTPTQRRRGLEMLGKLVRPDGLKVAMSGTPWRGKPFQLWGTLNWLDDKKYGGFWRWAQQYWELGGYSGYEIGAMKPEREHMLWDSLKPILLRRTKMEVAADLPEKTHVGTRLDPSDSDSPVGVWLPMDPKQQKLYDQMAQLSSVKLPGGMLDAIGPLAQLTRLRQLATSCGQMDSDVDFRPTLPSNKFEYIVELLGQLGYPDDPQTKVIIVSQFVKVLEMINAGLARVVDPARRCMLTGKVTGKRRQQLIEGFNSIDGGPEIMMMNTKVGGTAITIDTADVMVFVDEARNPDDQLQAEDRIHRVSNPRPVWYHYLRSIGTVDVGTAIVAGDRSAEGRRLLDERREAQYAERVMEIAHGG